MTKRATISRRSFLRGAAIGTGTIAAGPFVWKHLALAYDAVEGVHLSYGDDPRTEMRLSWSTPHLVEETGQTLIVGDRTFPAVTRPVVAPAFDGILPVGPTLAPTVPYQRNYVHAAATGLDAGTEYEWRIVQTGSQGDRVAATGRLKTAPAAAEAFRFTAFGDQGVSSAAREVTKRVRRLEPAFQFHVGDLCYSSRLGGLDRLEDPLADLLLGRDLVADNPDPAVWEQWFAQIAPRDPAVPAIPWMTTVGNHEIETGYGRLGYDGYYRRFHLPRLWDAQGNVGETYYSFRYGNVAMIALDANDASTQISVNRGYTRGAQDAWLADTLAAFRGDPTIDFIVVGYHHCSYCTNALHGSDQGVRDRWHALFDRHSVDLVINGHNHCYERTYPLRGGCVVPGIDDVARAIAGGAAARNVDSSRGTTYVTAGGGGNQAYPVSLWPVATVNVEGGARVPETALWSATRVNENSLLLVEVAPGSPATMTLKALRPDGSSIERVTLRRGG